MTSLAEILHNIADHTETLLHVLNSPGIPGDVISRLNSHILLEEKENTVQLETLHSNSPTPLTQKLLDHSFFIQRMLEEQSIPMELRRELLDHFMEEHQQWSMELAAGVATDPAATASNTTALGPQWTVGPLWTQGG